MEIRQSRRILCIGPPDSGVLDLLRELSGSAPTPKTIVAPSADTKDVPTDSKSGAAPSTTTAGLTHSLSLKTKYYSAEIPIWLDEVPVKIAESQSSGVAAWKADFLDPAAQEVTSSLGAWIVVFRKQSSSSYRRDIEELIEAIEEVTERQGEGLWEGGLFAIGTKPSGFIESSETIPDEQTQSENEQWDSFCFDHGFEYIDGTISAAQGGKRDALGEVKGMARLKEALEACDWSSQQDDEGSDMLELDDDDDFGKAISSGETGPGFDLESAQMGSEFAALSNSLRQQGSEKNEDVDEQQVEELEKMMSKMLAARDMSAHMPTEQRKRFAAKTVNDLLRGMDPAPSDKSQT